MEETIKFKIFLFLSLVILFQTFLCSFIFINDVCYGRYKNISEIKNILEKPIFKTKKQFFKHSFIPFYFIKHIYIKIIKNPIKEFKRLPKGVKQ